MEQKSHYNLRSRSKLRAPDGSVGDQTTVPDDSQKRQDHVPCNTDNPADSVQVGEESHDRLDTTAHSVRMESAHSLHSVMSDGPLPGDGLPDLKPQLQLPALSKRKVFSKIEEEFFSLPGNDEWSDSSLRGSSKRQVVELLTQMETRVYEVSKRVLDTFEEEEGQRDGGKGGVPPELQRLNDALRRATSAKKELRRQERCATSKKARMGLRKSKLKMVRRENHLKHKIKRCEEWLAKKAEMRRFKRDRWRYAKSLLNGEGKKGKPSFSAEDAKTHFTKVNSDADRACSFAPRPQMVRPDPPVVPFDLEPPTREEWGEVLKRKRVKSAAGMNGIPYRLYKGCPKIFAQLVVLLNALWCLHGVVPPQWGVARSILLSKSEVLNDPKEFRPISVTNAEARLFWSALERKLTEYFCANQYFRREEQKGFIPGVAGCMEQNELCAMALKLAKSKRKKICVVWIDLANAYGSVKHGLIQFMLQWYHVPASIQELVFVYYEGLRNKIFTEDWTTDWFAVGIGVFQGCTLSTVLFNGVFQLLLDMIRIEAPERWRFKSNENDVESFEVAQLAYADDLSMYRDAPAMAQKALNVLLAGLDWTRTMKVKVRKCVSFAMGLFRSGEKGPDGRRSLTWHRPDGQEVVVTQDHLTDFDTFDPMLVIAGEACPTMDSDKGFKMLGKWLQRNLSDANITEETEAKLLDMLSRTDGCLLTGPCKVWIYNAMVLAKLSWEFLTYDFGTTRIAQWEHRVTQFLKKWLGVMKNAHAGVFYRPRTHVGLGVRSLSTVAKSMAMTRRVILERSQDPNVLALGYYTQRRQLSRKRWAPARELASARAEGTHRRMLRGAQVGTAGLGYGRNTSEKEEWREVFQDLQAEVRLTQAIGLKMAGAWMSWSGVALSGHQHFLADQLCLEGGIGRPGPRVLKFLLNAVSETNCTAANHHRWFGSKRSCTLCGKKLPGLQHILGGCQGALDQGRFTWRHDSVLQYTYTALRDHLLAHNKKKGTADAKKAVKLFVKAGEAPPKKLPKQYHPFDAARDWQICADLGTDYKFTHFATSNKRPDILIWSDSIRKLYSCELTTPCEENIPSWHNRKSTKYIAEMELAMANGWDVDMYAFEVGARGFVARSTGRLLKAVNYPRTQRKVFLDNVSRIALDCSTLIYLRRHCPAWEKVDLKA